MVLQRRFFAVALVVIVATSAPSWALCLQEAATSTMACCESVTSDCAQMNQVMTCCAAQAQTNHETSAARAEPSAARAVVHQPVLFNAGLPASLVPLPLSVRALADLAPDPLRLTNSVLLI